MWVKKKKDQILMARNHLKSWKISQSFFLFSEFQNIVLELWYKSVSPERNFECQYETLTDNLFVSIYSTLRFSDVFMG